LEFFKSIHTNLIYITHFMAPWYIGLKFYIFDTHSIDSILLTRSPFYTINTQ